MRRTAPHERIAPERHFLWIELQYEVFDRLVVSGPDLFSQCAKEVYDGAPGRNRTYDHWIRRIARVWTLENRRGL